MMPAVLLQATFKTFMSIVGGAAGIVLLLVALIPGVSNKIRRVSTDAPYLNLPYGIGVAICLLLPLSLWRTGQHSLRVVALGVIAVLLLVALLGISGTALQLAERISQTGPLRTVRATPVPIVVAVAILLLVAALPRAGQILLGPLLLLLGAGGTARTLSEIVLRRQREPVKWRREPIWIRAVEFLFGGVLMLSLSSILWQIRIVHYEFMLPMADSVLLSTHVFLPPGSHAYPIILIRTPFGKNNEKVLTYIEHGYGVVLQDTRGRFASQGDKSPFSGDSEDTLNDGANTVEWISAQDWCNGKIGTLSSADTGIIDVATAGAGTPYLSTQYIVSGSPSLYNDVLYPGGIFRQDFAQQWLARNGYDAKVMSDWRSHPTYDDYWLKSDFTDRWQRIKWPSLFATGWFDISTSGVVGLFSGINRNGAPGAANKQHLIIGPWTHTGMFSAEAGELNFPGADAPPLPVQDPLTWFDYTMKGKRNGIETLPAVTYYVMGDVSSRDAPGNRWKTSNAWPPDSSSPTSYYLGASKSLTSIPSPSNQPVQITLDPAHPVPTTGGAQVYLKSGPQDQRSLEGRADVATFTSEATTAPLEITGNVSAHLFVSSDAADTDIFVKLCDVYPDGRSVCISEGQLRLGYRFGFIDSTPLTPGAVNEIDIDMSPTSIAFNTGHKIRVLIMSSSVPGFEVNNGTGNLRPGAATVIAHNSIWLDAAHQSTISLPVVH